MGRVARRGDVGAVGGGVRIGGVQVRPVLLAIRVLVEEAEQALAVAFVRPRECAPQDRPAGGVAVQPGQRGGRRLPGAESAIADLDRLRIDGGHHPVERLRGGLAIVDEPACAALAGVEEAGQRQLEPGGLHPHPGVSVGGGVEGAVQHEGPYPRRVAVGVLRPKVGAVGEPEVGDRVFADRDAEAFHVRHDDIGRRVAKQVALTEAARRGERLRVSLELLELDGVVGGRIVGVETVILRAGPEACDWRGRAHSPGIPTDDVEALAQRGQGDGRGELEGERAP